MNDWTYKQITEMANTIARLTRELAESRAAFDRVLSDSVQAMLRLEAEIVRLQKDNS